MQCHRFKSIKKSYETYRHRAMHHFAKTQTTHNCCSKRSLQFCELSVITTDPWHQSFLESFQLFKINEPWKFRGAAFIRKHEPFQSSNATCAIFLSKLATPLFQPVTDGVVEMQGYWKFSIVQNKRTTKVSWRCFYTKVRNISKFKCYTRDILIQNWPHHRNKKINERLYFKKL